MVEKYRVGIVGAGRMGSHIDDELRGNEVFPSLQKQLPYSHTTSYLEFPDRVEITAVSDLDEQKCRIYCDRWRVPRFYADYRELIMSEKPDIISIATPAVSHREIAVFAAENGVRGIYCEKPMCCSLDEADSIVAAVRKNGVKFMLGAQRRHHPIFKKAKSILQSGVLGELVTVTSWFSSSLLHSLSHTVDYKLFFADDAKAVSVYGVLGDVQGRDGTEMRRVKAAVYSSEENRWIGDPGCLLYAARMENGVFLHHLQGVTDVRFEIGCTDGYMRILDNTDSLHIYKRRGQSYSFDEQQIPETPFASSHRELVRDLLESIETGREPLAGAGVALNGMEILMGAAQSHLDGGWTVPLPLQNRAMYIPAH